MARVLVPMPMEASTPKELKDTLWKAADKLRGSMDASQYKDVVLGLVFLKYVSDAFEERRDAIRQELADHAEYGRWELHRTVVYMSGKQRAWLRRKIIRVPRPPALPSL